MMADQSLMRNLKKFDSIQGLDTSILQGKLVEFN